MSEQTSAEYKRPKHRRQNTHVNFDEIKGSGLTKNDYTKPHQLTLEKEIQSLITQPISDSQLSYAVKGDVNIILYTDLATVQDIKELFQKTNNVVILLPVDAINDGHYITLLHYPDRNHLVVFDSYGLTVQMDISKAKWLRRLDLRIQQRLPDLLKMFQSQGGTIDVNDIEFQNNHYDVATCGKFSVARILYRHIVSNKDFHAFLKYKNLSPDEIVSLMFI